MKMKQTEKKITEIKLKNKIHFHDGSYDVNVNKNVIKIPSTKDIINVGELVTDLPEDAVMVVNRGRVVLQFQD